jgi:hypothetical protein
MITLSLEQLKKMLGEAYEAGWYGALELKDDFVKKISDKSSSDFYSLYQTSTINSNQLTFSYIDENTISVNLDSLDFLESNEDVEI